MTASVDLTAAAHDAEEKDMTPTMEQLQALKDKRDAASKAYHGYKSDGTLASDIEEKRRERELGKTGAAYREAIDAYLAAQAARNDRNLPRDYALEQEAERETAQGVGELRKAGL